MIALSAALMSCGDGGGGPRNKFNELFRRGDAVYTSHFQKAKLSGKHLLINATPWQENKT